MINIWHKIPCNHQELNLKVVLSCGQSFRWKQSSEDPQVWVGVLNKKLWLLQQSECGSIQYQTLSILDNDYNLKISNDNFREDEIFLKSYFQFNINVSKLYEQWSKNDLFFKDLKTPFYGIRILRQDPTENLFSFICSQNNNIVRITQLVEKLCENYGEHIATFEDKKYYSFPTISALAGRNIEQELRGLGFGYRAKFIQKVAETIRDKVEGDKWLFDLRESSYKEAHKSKLMDISQQDMKDTQDKRNKI